MEVDELSSAVRGPLFQPGQDGYDAERVTYNSLADLRPDLIVGASGAADVMAAVRFATSRGMPVSVLSAGHQISIPAGGLLISTRRMNGVRVDPIAATATVQAGAVWGQVVHEAAAFGLAPLNGSSPNVGVVPYILGGGVGMLGRLYGFAADQVRQLDLVTADGQVRQVSEEREPDLFWALRGGKGNFGVVTAMEFDLMPVARLYGGGLFFDATAAAKVLHVYRDWSAIVPDAMGSSVLLAQFPPLPQIPEPLRGRYVVHVRIAYAGPPDEGERLVRPLREVAQPFMDTVTDMPYRAVGTIHNEPTDPSPTYDRASLLRELDHSTVEALLALAGPDSGAPYLVELRHLGGAYLRPPRVPSAVGQREESFNVFSLSPVFDPAALPGIVAAHDRLHEGLAPWSSGRLVPNFMSSIGPVELAYEPAQYARLLETKVRYDPDDVFHSVPHVRPR